MHPLLRLDREHRFEFDPNASQMDRTELPPHNVDADDESNRVVSVVFDERWLDPPRAVPVIQYGQRRS